MTPAPITVSEGRQCIETQDVVAGKDAVAIDRHPRVAGGFGADAEQDFVGSDGALDARLGRAQAHRMGVDERGFGGDEVDAVAL